MSEIANNVGRGALAGTDPAAMQRRLFQLMCWAVALGVAISLPIAPWRVTTGLLLGGVLSLFNHHWLRTSLAAAFGTAQSGRRVKLNAARYVLRYFVIAGVVSLAYALDLISIVATLVGLCSFVVAAMIEAFIQIYFAVLNREEN
jgi:hypothetical protein